jgi:hypothetical protein
MIKHFKYFRGFDRTALEAEFINTDRFDIIGLRQSLGLLIDLHLPNSAAEIKSDLELCAQRKREALVNTSRFERDEHLEFFDHYEYNLRIEGCIFTYEFLFTYYTLYLVDQIDDQYHWILINVNFVKDWLQN